MHVPSLSLLLFYQVIVCQMHWLLRPQSACFHVLLLIIGHRFVQEHFGGLSKDGGCEGGLSLLQIYVLTLSHVALNFATRCPAEGLRGVALNVVPRGLVDDVETYVRAMGRLISNEERAQSREARGYGRFLDCMF